MTEIQNWLFEHQDETYATFIAKLTPNLEREKFIGIRTPQLKIYANELIKAHREREILDTLKHTYFEENQLHAFILSEWKNYEELLTELEKFLPYVDNWATCDQLRPKILQKHREEFAPYIDQWIASKDTYTIRFGIGMLLRFYLDDWFDVSHLSKVAGIQSDEYYVNMMIAWYFATALAKQYEQTIPIFEAQTLGKWVHNKSIQKARESRRVSQEQKEYLKTLKK